MNIPRLRVKPIRAAIARLSRAPRSRSRSRVIRSDSRRMRQAMNTEVAIRPTAPRQATNASGVIPAS